MNAFSSTSIFLLLSLLLLHTGVKGEDPAEQQCSDAASYTSNSQFETNLKLLLSSLLSNGTRDGYFNTSIGIAPDRVYGLVSCRGDLFTHPRCRNCLYNSTVDVFRICPNRKQALLWYWDCILRYSNDSQAFIKVDLSTPRGAYNIGKASDADHFNQTLSTLMNNLTGNASSIPTRYDSGRIDYKPSQPIEGFVQCIRDLSDIDCYNCLQNLFTYSQGCCANNIGGHFYTTSCALKFEIYRFLESPAKTVFPPFEASPPQSNKGNGTKSSNNIVVIVVPTVLAAVVFVFLSIIAIFFRLRRKKEFQIIEDADEISTVESLQFNFATVEAATDNFSDANKLGAGGFGSVYKGKFSEEREIAVKRLSRNSSQGLEEFKNEVLLLAKLQHRNLVRLLGFCVEGMEKLLIYEFVTNASLDKFIFDPIKRTYLNWETRYKIIGGIARGLLYLHEDSRVRIIHRDLKASNILIDDQMNPKISDFGMARLFVVDQTEGSTSRIVGTYGYMAPEYAMHGHFSVKSDVFSFGVLVLEIISGQKNNSFYQSERSEDLLCYAWRQWQEGNGLELLEPVLREHFSRSEFMQCIHIGLLCVQDDVAKRPTMASVVLMLNSYSVTLALPSAPPFSGQTTTKKFDMQLEDEPVSDSSQPKDHSVNEVSITELDPR